MKNPAPINRVTELTKQQIATLKSHWIISIQEFLALTDLPTTSGNLAQLLGTDKTGLKNLTVAAQNQLSAMRDDDEEKDEGLAELTYASGALAPPAAMREKISYEKIPQEAPLPPALSYSDDLPPIRNQGSRGSCVAHAAAAVREFMEVQRLKRSQPNFEPKEVNFSEQFIYWWCKEQDGLPDVSGTYPYMGMQCLLDAGVAREKTWPYNPRPEPGNEGQGPPPAAAIDEARRYRISRIIHLKPDDIESMKAALLQGKSVMITIPMYDSWFRSRVTRKYGKINLPLPNEKQIGAHAMALVGYADDEDAPGGGYFLLRNAWKPWAIYNPISAGLGAIPYDFLRQYNNIADTGDLLITADVYIRDNDEDRGEAPSRGLTFNSPDIWVRQEEDGLEGHQPPVASKQNWLYVRAWNLGPEIATHVRAELFAAPVSPSIWPDMWQPIGKIALPHINAGASAVAARAWTPQDGAPRRFLVRLSAAEDPPQHQWAVRYDNNIAQKNLVQVRLHPGESATLTFPIYGLPTELTLRHIRVERKAFRRGRIGLQIENGETFREGAPQTEDQVLQTFAGQATETRTATLSIKMDEQATAKDGGRLIISQTYSRVLVGRMMVDVAVIE